jgi:hypothetical protein
MPEEKLLYGDLTHNIIGAAMEVHRILGPGFLEAVDEEALLLNYLKVTKLRVGLTINFGELSLTYIRRVL